MSRIPNTGLKPSFYCIIAFVQIIIPNRIYLSLDTNLGVLKLIFSHVAHVGILSRGAFCEKISFCSSVLPSDYVLFYALFSMKMQRKFSFLNKIFCNRLS